MSVDDVARESAVDDGGAATRRRSGRSATGVALMLASSIANQSGAGLGALAFPTVGPVGVVAVRQMVAALVLGALARPSVRGLRWAQWWPVITLAVVLSTMNLALYIAIDRVGLGLAVSLEFLGPLSVALCALRGARDLTFAAAAGVGVYVLVLPGPSTDYLGVACGLLAAGCWATYILLNRVVGQRHEGLQGSALATAMAAVVFLPIAGVMMAHGTLWGLPLLYALGAGLLSSALPYAADLMALRRVPAGLFAIFTSLNPVWAALIGMLVLGQFLAVNEWIGMAVIVAANAAVVSTRRSP